MEGAYRSIGGQSFICMNSTFQNNGTMATRIRPTLEPGSIVTCPRTATHMVVTEFGIANLKGKSTRERAEALIAIAHPKFQEELIQEAEKMQIWRTANKAA